jgi:hypothetical protein
LYSDDAYPLINAIDVWVLGGVGVLGYTLGTGVKGAMCKSGWLIERGVVIEI